MEDRVDALSLADLLNEKEEEISKLKKVQKELNEKLIKAGELGNGLLEQNSSLEEMFDNSQREHARIVEEYEQEKYSLENKLEVMTKMKSQVESNLNDETQRWKSKFEQMEQQLNKKHSDETAVVKVKLDDVNNQLQQEKWTSSQRLVTLNLKENQIQKLQKELKQMQTSLNDTLSTEMAELTNENCELKLQIQEYEISEHELTQTVQQFKDMLEKGKINEENLRQAKEDAEKETNNYYSSLERCREECRELQAELDILKLQPSDPNSRGNSLFAEVEDKRVQAEKNLISMKTKYMCMQNQLQQMKHYTLKLKMQISALLETRSRTTDQQHVQSLEESLSVARSDNSKLIHKLKILQDKLSKRFDDHHLPEDIDSSDQSALAQFFKNELKERSSEVERLTEELRLSEIYLMAEAKKVSALDRELYDKGRQHDAANSAKFKMQIEIDRLRMKCGEDVKVRSYQHKWKSEKITNSSPEKENASSPENKENEEPQIEDDESRLQESKDKLQKPNSNSSHGADVEHKNGEGKVARQPLTEIAITRELCMGTTEQTKPVKAQKMKIAEVNEDLGKADAQLNPDESKIRRLDSSRVTTAADCKQQ